MRKLSYFTIISSCLLLITGCKHSRTIPNPNDTIVPGGLRSSPNYTLNGKESIDGEVSLSERDVSVMNSLENKDVFDIIKNEKANASVLFGFDQSTMKSSEREKIRSFANSHSNAKCLIVGHCDWYGTEEYNLGLGERRAQSVYEFLRSIGFTGSMEILSRGSRDSTPGLSKENSFRDRRSDVFVLE